MPYMRMDKGAYEDIVSGMSDEELEGMDLKPPSGEFEYEDASASFVPGTLGPVAELTRGAGQDPAPC